MRGSNDVNAVPIYEFLKVNFSFYKRSYPNAATQRTDLWFPNAKAEGRLANQPVGKADHEIEE